MRSLSSTLLILALGCAKQEATEPAKTAEAAKAAEPAKAAAADHHAASQPAAQAQADANGVIKAGAAIGHENVVAVSEVLANVAAYKGKSIRVQGTIEQVCQTMGCWMQLAGAKPGEGLRIMSKDHGFFFPKSSAGQLALVEGEVAVKELSVEEAQHMEDEKSLKPGEQPKKITAPVQEISITAIGAEIKKAG